MLTNRPYIANANVVPPPTPPTTTQSEVELLLEGPKVIVPPPQLGIIESLKAPSDILDQGESNMQMTMNPINADNTGQRFDGETNTKADKLNPNPLEPLIPLNPDEQQGLALNRYESRGDVVKRLQTLSDEERQVIGGSKQGPGKMEYTYPSSKESFDHGAMVQTAVHNYIWSLNRRPGLV